MTPAIRGVDRVRGARYEASQRAPALEQVRQCVATGRMSPGKTGRLDHSDRLVSAVTSKVGNRMGAAVACDDSGAKGGPPMSRPVVRGVALSML